jgi:thioredoxin-like negative regulator of GroEL
MPTQPVDVADETFGAQVVRAPGPVLVDFWAPWCAPCLALEPALEQLAAEFAGSVQVARLNIDRNPSPCGGTA